MDELTAQKGTIQNLVNGIEILQKDTSKLEERLKNTFKDWNQRLADMDNKTLGFKNEVQSLVQTLSNIIHNLTEDVAIILSGQSPPPGIPTKPKAGATKLHSKIIQHWFAATHDKAG